MMSKYKVIEAYFMARRQKAEGRFPLLPYAFPFLLSAFN
jgi:hypothetical protein